jgi:putative two-component system response regulator
MGNLKTLLIVDDAPENIDILKSILKPHYALKVATGGRLALQIGASGNPPDLILLDVLMPDMDGYEVCRELKASPLTRGIPVIFVTARADAQDEVKGFALGGVDYIIKPVSAPVVLARVATHLALNDRSRLLEELVQQRTAMLESRTLELQETRLQILQRLGRAGEYRAHFADREHLFRTNVNGRRGGVARGANCSLGVHDRVGLARRKSYPRTPARLRSLNSRLAGGRRWVTRV